MVVCRSRNPVRRNRNQFESFYGLGERRCELSRGLVQRRAIQPDDVPLIVRELSVVAIVRSSVTQLTVVVDNRVRMIGVSLVHVLCRRR